MGAVKGIIAMIGIAAILMGGLWILQGLDIVRWPASSFMLGDTTWTRNGIVLAVVGVVLIWFGRKRPA
jgi:membrane protein implicated in regulation of membrane protease activity